MEHPTFHLRQVLFSSLSVISITKYSHFASMVGIVDILYLTILWFGKLMKSGRIILKYNFICMTYIILHLHFP